VNIPPSSSLSLQRIAAQWNQRFGAAARKGGITLADQSLVSGTNFLTTVLIGRLCGPAELGIYSVSFTLVVVLGTMLQALVAVPYTVFVQRLQDPQRSEYSGGVLVHCAILSVLAMLGLGGLALALERSGAATLAPAIWVLSATIPFLSLREFCRRMAFAHMQLTTVFIFDAAAVALQLTGLGILVLTGRLSAVSGFALVGLCCAVVSGVWLYSIRDRFSLRAAHVRQAWRQNWKFSKWVVVEHTAAILNTNVMQWLLAAMLGTAATGLFAACAAILNVFNPIALGINNILMPRIAVALSERGPGEVRRVVRKATLAMVAVTALFCGTILIFGTDFMRLLYGAKYAGQESIIRILALDMLVQSLGSPSAYGLWAFERSRTLFFVRLIRIAVAVPLVVCLIPYLGAVAAAWGLLSGNIAGTIITWWLHNRLLAAEESTTPADPTLRVEEIAV
jgi:O-antigen/teichoic acid export membrane protein